MAEISSYLLKCKSQVLQFQNNSKYHIVLGNPACDLDSAVSAVSMAYYLNKSKKEDTIFLPMLNINSEDYALKTEVVHCFDLFKINKDHLIFRDTVDLRVLKDKLSLTLVDHHVLDTHDEQLKTNIVEIIDHRKQEIEFDLSVKKTIELVGSCATLVSEKMLIDQAFHVPQDIAFMLFSTVLLDTICLSEQANKKTEKDEHVIAELENILELQKSRTEIFEEFLNAKMDVTKLSNRDILRKDLKLVEEGHICIAMSSIPMNITHFIKLFSVAEDLKKFVTENNYHALVIMTFHMDEEDQIKREIAVFSLSLDIREQVNKALLESSDPNLGLSPISETTIVNLTIFNQTFCEYSRKQVLPIIKRFVKINLK